MKEAIINKYNICIDIKVAIRMLNNVIKENIALALYCHRGILQSSSSLSINKQYI